LGRSRGGVSTKLHVLVEAFGRPVCLKLSAGQEADCQWAIPLVTDFEFGTLLGDKGYDTQELRSLLKDRGADACIPAKSNRVHPEPHDSHLYKERNWVERFFNRLKQYRRLATRYEKTARNYLGMIHLVSAVIWLTI
jgi:transposase